MHYYSQSHSNLAVVDYKLLNDVDEQFFVDVLIGPDQIRQCFLYYPLPPLFNGIFFDHDWGIVVVFHDDVELSLSAWWGEINLEEVLAY